MGVVSNLHNKAMECVDYAVMERRRGNEKRATEFFEQALKFERTAIAELDDQNGLSWSILHRSAGWLALDCNRPHLAAKLARKALAGNPHPRDCRGTARPDQRNPRTNGASHSAAL